MVRSISALFACGVTILLMANDGAAFSIARKNDPELLPGSGLKMTPTSSIEGASSFKNDSHLLPRRSKCREASDAVARARQTFHISHSNGIANVEKYNRNIRSLTM